MSNPWSEKRIYERISLQLPAVYILNGTECPCHIVDISLQGIGMRVRGALDKGDTLRIILGRLDLKSTVVRVDGNIVGVTFDQLTEAQLNEILSIKNRM